MKILANDTAILIPMDVPLFWRWFSPLNWNEFSFRMRPSISLRKRVGIGGLSVMKRIVCLAFVVTVGAWKHLHWLTEIAIFAPVGPLNS